MSVVAKVGGPLWLHQDLQSVGLEWRNSNGDIKRVLTIAYFDHLGIPRLS